MTFATRFARDTLDDLPGLAQERVRLKPAVIVTARRVATQDAVRATITIPIVRSRS